MVVYGLLEAIGKKLLRGLLVPTAPCSGMTRKVAILGDHLAPLLVVLTVALGHASVHRLVGWPLSLRLGLRDVVTLQFEVKRSCKREHKAQGSVLHGRREDALEVAALL
eukprot:5290195-Pleurochrysis_carterae.AAC.2